jgi:hypothetical protein
LKVNVELSCNLDFFHFFLLTYHPTVTLHRTDYCRPRSANVSERPFASIFKIQSPTGSLQALYYRPLVSSVLNCWFSGRWWRQKRVSCMQETGSSQGINAIIPNNTATPRVLTLIDNFQIRNKKKMYKRRKGITREWRLCETHRGDAE